MSTRDYTSCEPRQELYRFKSARACTIVISGQRNHDFKPLHDTLLLHVEEVDRLGNTYVEDPEEPGDYVHALMQEIIKLTEAKEHEPSEKPAFDPAFDIDNAKPVW